MRDGRTIGVLTPLVAGPYFGSLLSRLAHAAAAHGVRSVVVQTLDAAIGDTHSGAPHLTGQVGWEQYAGVIAVAAAASDEYLARLHATGIPLVLISHQIAGLPVPTIAPDNVGGINSVVSHLFAHGHRKIAFVGRPGQADMIERYRAYREALTAHGLKPAPELFFDAGNHTQAGGEAVARRMVEAGLPATAAVAGNDLTAIGLLTGLQAAGYQVPDDLAVVGFDDNALAENLVPALSSVNQDVGAVGALAIRLLLDLIDGKPVIPGQHLVPTALVSRRSCGCAAGASSSAVPDAAEPTPDGLDPQEQLARELLAAVLPYQGDDDAPAEACAAIAAAMSTAAAGGPVPDDLDAHVLTVYQAHPRRGTGAAMIAAAQAAARRWVTQAKDPEGVRRGADDGVRRLALAIKDASVSDLARTNAHLQVALRHEYDISMELLRGHEHDPAALLWLRYSPIRAGCLALSSGDPEHPSLEIVSTYGPVDTAVIGPVREEEFPPPELIDVVNDNPGQLVVVLPVRTDQRDWGLLAVVGPPETRTLTGRETYFQWAAMLGVALDYEATVDSLRTQRGNLAQAYARERELAESFRASEQRYALAASAASDGLWDWDLRTDRIYYSPRWKAMLGYDDDDLAEAPEEWLGRVHVDDVEALRGAIERCRTGDADTIEHEHRVVARDGSYRWMLCRALAVPGNGSPATRLVGSQTDITERRAMEQQLRQQALYDPLTGLPNRALFLDRLGRSIARSRRHDGTQYAVLFCDLDGFKAVNDSLGHATGDLLLRQVGERIRTGLRASDTAARIGGDEFTVLVEDIVDPRVVPAIAAKLQERIAQPYDVDGSSLVLSATVGIATSASGYARAEDVVRDADIAMYHAKSTERGTCLAFDPSMLQGAVTRQRVESELRGAIAADQLVLRYQPVVRLDTGIVTALEALVRWDHPERGLVGPADFLPIAEVTGLIVPIGRWVVGQACAQMAEWVAAGAVPRDLAVSVNISNREFWADGLLEHVKHGLDRNGLVPGRLTLEITEGVLMGDAVRARAKLEALHEVGLRLHIDDFGTGYSSLEALHRLPIDALKIDRSFVSGMDHEPRSRELAHTIIAMGSRLGIDVIAEGIETRDQCRQLVDLGCVLGQGFLFAVPAESAEIPALVGSAGLNS